MMRWVKKALKLLLGVFILPAAYQAANVLWRFVDQAPVFGEAAAFLIIGAVGYLLVHTLIGEPDWFYVVGHELTHALCGILCMARITDFKASSKGGSVTLSKSNFFISLGPYLIPFYTLITVLVFLLLRLTGIAFLLVNYFLALVGFTWALHTVMTVKYIKMKQPDLAHTGPFFSLALIILVNILVLAWILSWAIPGFNLFTFFQETYTQTRETYSHLFIQLFL
jgi:hypothetical protein